MLFVKLITLFKHILMKTTLESAVRLNDHYGEPGPPEEPIFFRSHNNLNINFLPISVIH